MAYVVCVGVEVVRDRPTTLMRCPVTQVLYSIPSVIQPSIKYQNLKKMIIVYCMFYLYIRLNTRKQTMMSHYAQVQVTRLRPTTVFLHFILAHFVISIFSIGLSRKLIEQ